MDFCKKKTSENEEDVEHQYGQTWIWTALDAATRLLVGFCIGDRTLEEARRFMKEITERMTDKPLFVSDELPHYANVLLELFHEMVEPERTGKPGRPRKAQPIPDADLDYATVHKFRENGRVVKVETQIVYGDVARIGKRLESSPSRTINTSYIERSNLDWRLWDAHLTRKTLTFAKTFRWLKAKFAICVMFYNFIRPHGTLSRKAIKTTPAMEAGVTDHIWSIIELIKQPMLMSTE